MTSQRSEWRDTRPMNWARSVARLRRLAEELKHHGFTVTEPDNLETPPERRIAST